MEMSESQLRPDTVDKSDTQINIRRDNVGRDDSLHASNHEDKKSKGDPEQYTEPVIDDTVDKANKLEHSDFSERQKDSDDANTGDKNEMSVDTEKGKTDDTESSSGASVNTVQGDPKQCTAREISNPVSDETVENKDLDQSGKGDQHDISEKQRVSVDIITADRNKNSVGTTQGKNDDTESSSGANVEERQNDSVDVNTCDKNKFSVDTEKGKTDDTGSSSVASVNTVQGDPKQCTLSDETVDKNKELDQSGKGYQHDISEKQRVNVDIITADKNKISVASTQGKTDDTESSLGANVEEDPEQNTELVCGDTVDKTNYVESQKHRVRVDTNTADKNKISVGTTQGKTDETESSSGASVEEDPEQCTEPMLDDTVDKANYFDQSAEKGKTDDTKSSSGANANNVQGDPEQCTEPVPDDTGDKANYLEQSAFLGRQKHSVDVNTGDQNKISVDTEKGKTHDTESSSDSSANNVQGDPKQCTKHASDETVEKIKEFDQSGKGYQKDRSEKQSVVVDVNPDDKNKTFVGKTQGKTDDTEYSSGGNIKGGPKQCAKPVSDETVDKEKKFDQSGKGNEQDGSEKQSVSVDINMCGKSKTSVGTTQGKTDDTESASGANVKGDPEQCTEPVPDETVDKTNYFEQSNISERQKGSFDVNTGDQNKMSVDTEKGKTDDTGSSSGASVNTVQEAPKQCINPVLDELVDENNEFDQSGKGHQKDSSERESNIVDANMSDKNKISVGTAQGKTDDTEGSSGANVKGNPEQCTEPVPDDAVDKTNNFEQSDFSERQKNSFDVNKGDQIKISVDTEKGNVDDTESSSGASVNIVQGDPEQCTQPVPDKTVDKTNDFEQSDFSERQKDSLDVNTGDQNSISVDRDKGKTDDTENYSGASVKTVQGDPKQFTKPVLGETIDKNKEFDQSGKGNQQDSSETQSVSVDVNMGDKNKNSVGTAQGKTDDIGANVKDRKSGDADKAEADRLSSSAKQNHFAETAEQDNSADANGINTKAQFTDILTDQVVKEEGPLVMKCKLNKQQSPVKWLINDTRIEEKEYGKRIKITKDGLHCCLVLIHAKLSDAGQYSCVCDEDRTECKVKVEEIPSEFTENLTEKHVKEKDTMKLICKLNKHDVPVIWYKDGKVIKSDDRTKISDHMYQHELVIGDLKLNDAGKYKCECGGASTECSVGVEGSFVSTLRRTMQTALRKWSPLLLIAFSVLLSFVINQKMSSLRSDIPISSTHTILPLVQKLESIERAVSTVKDERILQKKDLLGTLQKYQSEILQDRETKFKELSEKLENVKHEIEAKADADDIGKMKERFENKAIEMEDNFANTMAEMQKSVTDRAKDFTKSLEEFKSRVANYQASFESFEKETTEKTEKVKKSSSSLNVTVEQDLKTILQEVKVQLSGIKKAKQEADVILRHIKIKMTLIE